MPSDRLGRSQIKLIKIEARLVRHARRLELTLAEIVAALGLEHMRRIRNQIIHEGGRWGPWPVSEWPDERDWPQIVNGIAEEMLSFHLKATMPRLLRTHIERACTG